MGHNRDHRKAEEADIPGWMLLAEVSHIGFQCVWGLDCLKNDGSHLGFIPFLGQGFVRWVIRVMLDHNGHL